MTQIARNACGWHGAINTFLKVLEQDWLQDLKNHHLVCMNMEADESQIRAWKNCFNILQVQLASAVKMRADVGNWTIIFEYELPRERGRRPDVIILANDTILVLEFKGFGSIHQAHIDQVSAYARDLQHYHAGSHNRLIYPLLVLTQSKGAEKTQDGVLITSPFELPDVLQSLVDTTVSSTPIDPLEWLAADYAPLPSLVNAARILFQHEPLPHIKRANSARIPETIAELVQISRQARANNEQHLALVTGVPGAGKTLVGLQFVYENHFGDMGSKRSAVFLSGNGPLVKVLQHALKSPVFVQDVHGFLKRYGGSQHWLPEEHIWVYDEAQRAWDAAKVQEKRGHGASEPEDFLRLAERMNSWTLMVGLIGEGQEIHLGEEAGLEQWNAAIKAMNKPWTVHCPTRIASVFSSAAHIQTSDLLDLTASLRSHLAEDVQLWVKRLLEGSIESAAKTAQAIRDQGFDMYVTRDLEKAKQYVQERYLGQEEKRYGLLASSKARNLSNWGIRNDYNYTKNLREGPWYNDSQNSDRSCCRLHDVATEFACQGLELDFPIVGWGNDLLWRNNKWVSPPQPRSQAHNPHQLRLNSYRVLLSRGRDGFAVFVPPEVQMDSTYQALVNAGFHQL
ncbi:DNA/RNA helicase domain-containing protein [Dictyobacter formicarum]|uniref:Schlafen group 3-like DNA/RNA helicase domain-containing protein n=1 Tax=Dictyobacter formicarum TaxID=2778368 RepID=A0ABQ3VSC7_9CHLR|nr:DNA/RNA helicase domain-containing protein [Dictyobacter formicarum]GHO88021.1 hypothetical protein KSZ_60270 [Dictyobacter formicarum]